MNNRIVSCGICLEHIDIDNSWCVINKNKRYYECKNTSNCKEILLLKFPKVEPKVEQEIEDLPTINSETIYSFFSNFKIY